MPDELTHEFPQSVRDSLAELRLMAKEAKCREDVRRATPDEIALSETLRKPHHCVGHSSRTGLACRLSRVHGLVVCRKHGGSLKRVRANAAARLANMVNPVLNSMFKAATQDSNLAAAVKAGADLLDRSGVGELVQAKVRGSKHQGGDNRVVVQIGFLTNPDGQPLTIDAPKVGNGEA